MSEILSRVPKEFQKDVSSAIEILKNAGCKEVFIFGSLITGTYREDSDIDIAIKGCSPENYFALLGQLLTTLSRPVDLINLDRDDAFSKYLVKEGDLYRVS
ncbi:nucleotidyltransferase family protein [Desulfosporosinus sp.]|uniref:nucleotidyltransferase family protein n=1 Tax=Desulfosporosinus sp. TaxID=157907 RepID=UPI0025B7AE75|nr:nucleotidyltransferase domain-containing protein [Desulfosporosinus sp.]